MKVTEQQYYMDKKMIEILDLMIDRMTGKKKMDNLLIIDGDEGYGKSTFSAQIGNYVAEQSGREFNVANFFFDVDKMTDFAVRTSDQVIVWDEAALAGLAAEWQRKEQIKLIKLLMVARKKRHFWIFNIPKFFKMNEYVVLDRAIGLVHVYARNENELGRFIYLRKNKKAALYHKWRKSHIRAYNKYWSFRGTFPNVLDGIIDEGIYDKMKDEAILSIHKPIESPNDIKLRKYQKLIGELDMPKKEKAEYFGVDVRTLSRWVKLDSNKANSLENEGKT